MLKCNTCGNNYSERGFLNHSKKCQREHEDDYGFRELPRHIGAVSAAGYYFDPYVPSFGSLFSGIGALISCFSLLKIVIYVFLLFMGIYYTGQVVDAATRFSSNLTLSGAMMAPVNVVTHSVSDFGRDMVDKLRAAKDKEIEFVVHEAEYFANQREFLPERESNKNLTWF